MEIFLTKNKNFFRVILFFFFFRIFINFVVRKSKINRSNVKGSTIRLIRGYRIFLSRFQLGQQFRRQFSKVHGG